MNLIPLEEHRSDRPYDGQDAGTLVHPNGTLVASFHVGFLCAAGREVFAIYRKDAPRCQ